MKFNIIWVDDSKTWVKSVEEEVKEAFENIGFEPNITTFPETKEASDFIASNYADLIIVDCNLPDDVRGDNFIKQLREKRCFAHIIFYSQDNDNLQSLKQDKRFIHITHRSDIHSTLLEVATFSYRKYTHPAFMRGLLLSEFIDLENLMEDLISLCFRSEAEYFRETVIQKGGESFSLSAKQKFISRLIKELSETNQSFKIKLDEIHFTSNQFQERIINNRNILAHASPVYDSESESITLKSSIRDIQLTPSWFHETRGYIHEHKEKIRSLIDLNLPEQVTRRTNADQRS